MAKKSIYQIDVQDESFKRFYDLFKEYEEKLADLPKEWEEVNEAMNKTGRGFMRSGAETQELLAGMAAMATSVGEKVADAVKAQRDFERETNRSHRSMLKLDHAAKGVAKTVFGIGKHLLKWGAIGGAIAGIGGTVGLDDLAYSAMNRQRTARGIGMTPGQQAAFSTYFNQFGNADSVAGNIATARNDISKRWIFSGLGIGQSELANDSNFQLSILAERRAAQMVKSMPRATWASQAQAMGLTGIFDLNTLRVLRHTSSARLNAATHGAEKSATALGFSSKTAREWTDLQIQMRKAGLQIESSLITGLHKLAPELTVISRDLANWIQAFTTGPEMGKIITEVSTGLQEFAKFIGSSNFHKDLARFESEFGTAASEMAAIGKGLLPYAKAAGWVAQKTVQGAEGVEHVAEAGLHGLESGYKWVSNKVWGQDNNPGNLRHQNQFGRWVLNRYPTEQAGMQAMAQLLEAYPKRHHADTLASIIPVWNGHGKNDASYIKNVSDWSGYKPNQPLDLANATVRDRVMAAMIREEHSTKISTRQVQSDLSPGSRQGLPQSVNRLVNSLRKQRPNKPVQISITNSTPSRVAVQMNAAAY